MTYNHKEAYCLMWYSCTKCPHIERIWNSRDGVTPFGCNCPSCGGTMDHTNWNMDELAPDHQLRPMQKFWRDGTPDEAETIMRRRIEKFKVVPPGRVPLPPLTTDKEAALIASARAGDEDSEFRKGWPTLDVHRGYA